MKRLIFSTIGVILTFIWIIYTAPPSQHKVSVSPDAGIKTITRSGANFSTKISQPDYRGYEFEKRGVTNNMLVKSDVKKSNLISNEQE